MKNCAKINLCIIGSTGFGKSSIAASLLKVAATTDGSIHLVGSPTKIIQMANDLQAYGQHKATSWDEIAKIKFELCAPGKAWRISLYDYPGALFSKYIEQTSFSSRVKKLFSRSRNANQSEYFFDKTAEKRAKRLIAKLEHADALMVLIPADITEDKYNVDQSRDVYRQKLPEFIGKVLERKPNIPVCLCINKWDMFECGIERLPEILQQKPYCEYYQSLKQICGENLSAVAISAFGSHDPQDREKIDPNQEQKPLNLLESLLPLAEHAEKMRFERVLQDWKNSKWIKKALCFPGKMFSILKLGGTDKSIRKGFAKIAAKAWGLFTAFWMAGATIIFAVAVGVLCLFEWHGLGKLDQELKKLEKEPDSVKVENLNAKHSNLDSIKIIRKVFFKKCVNGLQDRLNTIEDNYNKGKVAKAESYRDSADHRDIGPLGKPETREKLAKDRKAEFERLKKDLTDRGSSQSHALDVLIDNEAELLRGIGQNRDFYTKAYNLLHDADENTICRRLDAFIQEEEKNYPGQDKLFAELRKHLSDKETSKASKLQRELEDIRHSNTKPTNWQEEVNLDQKLIDKIDDYEKCFAENSKNFEKFATKRKEISSDMGQKNKYCPFKQEYEAIKLASLDTRLKKIYKFRTTFKQDEYNERATDFDDLDRLETLTKADIKKAYTKELSNTTEPQDKGDFSAMSIYFEKRAAIFEKYRSYYPEHYNEYTELTGKLQTASANKNKYSNWAVLKNKVDKIVNAKNTSQNNPQVLMPVIQDFRTSFPRERNKETELAELYNTVDGVEQAAVTKLVNELENNLKEYPDSGEGEELQNNLQGRIRLITDVLLLLAGTDSYSVWQGQLQYCRDRLSEQGKIDDLQKAITTLSGELRTNITPRNKVEKMNVFFASYPDCEKLFPADWNYFKSEQTKYGRLNEWNNLKTKINEHLEKKPDDSDATKLASHKNECERLLDEANGYQESFITDLDKNKQELKDRIKLVETKIGKGSFADIQKKEEEYKKVPTEENYKKLRNAIEAFDDSKPENKNHVEKVKAIKTNSEYYYNAGLKYNEFLQAPNAGTWSVFLTDYRLIDDKYPKNYQKIATAVETFRQQAIVTVHLWLWNFENSDFSRKYTECQVYIGKTGDGHLEEAPDGDLYCYEIWGNKWHSLDPSYAQNTKRCLKKAIKIKEDGNIEIQFANTYRSNHFSNIHRITIYELIAWGHENGEYIYAIDESPGGGHLELKFTGLPKF